MGTRNLTMVIDQEGQKKIAQYGQRDGYPSGVGVGVLEFLRNKELLDKLKTNLPKVRFIDAEGRDKEFIENYDNNTPEWSNEPDNRTQEQIDWWETYCSRDLAEYVLMNIATSSESEILLLDKESTGRKGGWVEYCYVVNLKENTFSVYENLDSEAMKVFSLSDLPTKEVFLEQLEPSGEV